MAQDQAALLDPLGQLKLVNISDRIRAATETLYQQLIEAEATAFNGAAPFERSKARTTWLTPNPINLLWGGPPGAAPDQGLRRALPG